MYRFIYWLYSATVAWCLWHRQCHHAWAYSLWQCLYQLRLNLKKMKWWYVFRCKRTENGISQKIFKCGWAIQVAENIRGRLWQRAGHHVQNFSKKFLLTSLISNEVINFVWNTILYHIIYTCMHFLPIIFAAFESAVRITLPSRGFVATWSSVVMWNGSMHRVWPEASSTVQGNRYWFPSRGRSQFGSRILQIAKNTLRAPLTAKNRSRHTTDRIDF